MKVFVTGNLGYIGSVLTDILLEKNIDFIGYDIGYFKNCNLIKNAQKKYSSTKRVFIRKVKRI